MDIKRNTMMTMLEEEERAQSEVKRYYELNDTNTTQNLNINTSHFITCIINRFNEMNYC